MVTATALALPVAGRAAGTGEAELQRAKLPKTGQLWGHPVNVLLPRQILCGRNPDREVLQPGALGQEEDERLFFYFYISMFFFNF